MAVEEQIFVGERRTPRGRRARALIGEILMRSGKLLEGDIARVVNAQQEANCRFGDAARSLGLVTEIDVQRALASQFEYSHIDASDSRLHRDLILAHNPSSEYAEALRRIRTELLLTAFSNQSRALAVVAANSGEGCSTLAANLAIAFAQLGQRTLIVDANLREPRQQSLFGLESGIGLSDLLAGRGSFNEALTTAPHFDNLFVLAAGTPAPNPQELLARVEFSFIVETAPNEFDVVIVDTPPLLQYADARMIAARTGFALMSVRKNVSRMGEIARAQAELQIGGVQMLGAVLAG